MASYGERHSHSASSSLEPHEPPADIQFSLWHTFKRHIPRFILTIVFDVILPLVLFFLLQKRIKSVYALLIAGAPPLVMIFFKAVISRTFDALGFLVFVAFLISAIVAVVTHNDIILLLEKSLVTGVVSLLFGVTLIPFRCCQTRCTWRPLAYYFYQDLMPTKRAEVGLPNDIFDNGPKASNEQYTDDVSVAKVSDKQEVAQVYEWIYSNCPSFRRSCYVITCIWAIGFLLEFVGRLVLILVHLSVEKIVIHGHVILFSVTLICIILTIICITKERKRTLAFIKQWKERHWNMNQEQLKHSNVFVYILEHNCNSNRIIYEMNNK